MIGPNGAGKSTLFRMIIGEETPDGGTLKVGETVKLGYVDQSRNSLDDTKSVWEEISGGTDVLYLGKPRGAEPGLRGRLQLQGLGPAEEGRHPVGRRAQPGAPGQDAAPGEQRASCSTSRPTTSTSTRCGRWRTRSSEFAGCAVIISHDRWFLDRLATHILAFEGDSHVEWFEGNFQAYEEDKRRRLGADSTEPARIKYRPLSR